MKRFLSLLVCLVMVLSALPAVSLAEYADWDGSFTIRNAFDSCWLSHQQDTMTVSTFYPGEDAVWHIYEVYVDYDDPSSNRVLYQIRIPGKAERFDIDNAWMTQNNIVKLYPDTGHAVQKWYIEPQSDGTVILSSYQDANYVLALYNGQTVIQRRDDASARQRWYLQAYNDCRVLYSTNRTVVLHLPNDINNTISDRELIALADKWARAYKALVHLHYGKKPYSRIIFECNEPDRDDIYAYVIGYGDNHVYWPKNWFLDAMQWYLKRDNDWIFGALHEMGHLFDSYTTWDFDTEAMTDICLVYVLEMYNGRANQQTYVKKTLDAAGVEKAFAKATFKNGYDIFAAVSLVLKIKDAVGWGPFTEAFREMEANKTYEQAMARSIDKFDYFISMLSKYAGCDVTQFVKKKDYDLLRGYLAERN